MWIIIAIVTAILVTLSGIVELGSLFLTREQMELVHDAGFAVTWVWIALLLIAALRYVVYRLYDRNNR
ncbi:MAG: hypothetical protein WDZ93_00920 [Candidatus Paceibacterota bacterium]